MTQEVSHVPLDMKGAAGMLLGAGGECAFNNWSRCDDAVLEATISGARRLGLAREALAINLWRLSRSDRCASLASALSEAIHLGETTLARGLFAKLAERRRGWA